MQWRAYSKPRLASIHAWVCLDYTQKGNREEWLPVEHGGPVSLPGPWCLGLCSNKNEVTDWGPLWKIDTAASSLKARLRLITWAQTSLTHMHQSFIIQTLIGSVAVVPPYARWCVRACVCAAACVNKVKPPRCLLLFTWINSLRYFTILIVFKSHSVNVFFKEGASIWIPAPVHLMISEVSVPAWVFLFEAELANSASLGSFYRLVQTACEWY